MNRKVSRNGCCICLRLLWGIAGILFTVSTAFSSNLFASDHVHPCIASAQEPVTQIRPPGTSRSAMVAEGEYRVLDQSGIGSFDPAVYDFKESWTLWRLEDGTFEVDGTRDYRSPADQPHRDNFEARLSSSFQLVSLKEFRTLRWRINSGPLICDFRPGKVACTADKKRDLNLEVPVQAAAGLMWPISAFSLSSIARSASHDPKATTRVELLTFEEPSDADPIFTKTLGGYLRYLGQEKLSVAGRTWPADKFELKVATHAPFLLWTSSQGLLLAFAHKTDSNTLPHSKGMVLVSFRDCQQF